MQLPLEDRYLMQRGELLNQLAVLLGGRAAEEIALGEISTGAQNDLQRATDIARSMVTEWGMSERARRGQLRPPPPQPLPRHRACRPNAGPTARRPRRIIDDEVKRIVAEAHDEARRILRDHRDMLERVTRRLLENEVMEGDELRELMVVHPESSPAPVVS